MAGASTKSSSNPARARKRVEASAFAIDTDTDFTTTSLKRAKDGSAFTRCEECNRDVAVALISFHNCSLDAKIKMNLEAHVVESPPEVKKKPADPKTKSSKSTQPRPKREKKAKNPNAPKRPPTAFFVFMDEFRKSFKEANPDCKSVATVAKEGGEKWKSMTEEEKKPYVDRAAEMKAKYEKALESNNDAENQDDECDSSVKEVKEVTEVDEDDSSEKEVKEAIEVDEGDSSEKEVKEAIPVDEE